jgi:hypothetical protein
MKEIRSLMAVSGLFEVAVRSWMDMPSPTSTVAGIVIVIDVTPDVSVTAPIFPPFYVVPYSRSLILYFSVVFFVALVRVISAYTCLPELRLPYLSSTVTVAVIVCPTVSVPLNVYVDFVASATPALITCVTVVSS